MGRYKYIRRVSQQLRRLTRKQFIKYIIRGPIQNHNKIKDIDTGVLETTNVFPDTTTVYGGTYGVKLFLQDQVIQSLYRYERSGKEILSIELLDLYINSRSRRRDFSFRRIKMYGT